MPSLQGAPTVNGRCSPTSVGDSAWPAAWEMQYTNKTTQVVESPGGLFPR